MRPTDDVQAPLVLCAHGTRSAEGRAAVLALVEAVGATTGLPVRDAYVDVHGPAMADVLVPGATVVPLLLSPGYHTAVDVAVAAGAVPGVRVAPTLGPSGLLAELLVRRLREAGVQDDDAVVLAAAGSSRPESTVAVEHMAAMLAACRARPVAVAYGASREPGVPQAVAALRERGARRVAVAAYLLATGHFHQRLLAAGADLVTAPLVDLSREGHGSDGPVDPLLVDLVLARASQAREAGGRNEWDGAGASGGTFRV